MSTLSRSAGSARVPCLPHIPRAPRAALAGAAVAVALLVLGGCGTKTPAGPGDGDWRTMRTSALTVDRPGDFTEAPAAARAGNAALATRTVDGTRVATVSVQLDYMHATSAEMAAMGAEAAVQLGSTLEGTEDVEVDGVQEAKRVRYAFDSSGKKNTPPKGTRLQGTIIAGIDGHGDTFAVRIEYAEQHLSRQEVRRIIASIHVRS